MREIINGHEIPEQEEMESMFGLRLTSGEVVKVEITPEERKKIEQFLEKKNAAKIKEYEEQGNPDVGKIRTRGLTGVMGEYAVIKFLGYDWRYFDTDIGNSKEFDYADLKPFGYNLGVKSATKYNAPAVPENPKYGQVICTVDSYKNTVYILGFATPDIMRAYSDKSLIKDMNLKEKPKTGFYRFDQLKRLTSPRDIPEYAVADKTLAAQEPPHPEYKAKIVDILGAWKATDRNTFDLLFSLDSLSKSHRADPFYLDRKKSEKEFRMKNWQPAAYTARAATVER